jgi:methionyl-tRNA formyltransferase
MLRFAYGCLPSLMSLYFTNYLVRREQLIPGCIVLSVGGLRFRNKRYSTAAALPVLLKAFGPRFTGYLALSGLGAAIPGLRRGSRDAPRLLSFEQLAREYGIPLVLSDDFSSPETLARLEPLALDLFATCMCDQILREPLLSRPRLGCVNIHASLLPDFRGVDSIFQSMLHDAPEIGATLHRTTAKIDCGTAYGQVALARPPADSHMLLLAKAAALGARLLRDHVCVLDAGSTPIGTSIDPAKARFPYRSWPRRDELRQFRAKGLAYWRMADLRRVLRFDDVLAGEPRASRPAVPANGARATTQSL